MKILITGYGLIGRAIVSAFKNQHELIVIDPHQSTDRFEDHNDSDGCIICINTENDIEEETLSKFKDIINRLPIYMPILIKSSISPDLVDELNTLYPDHSIVISPDFSRTRSTEQDFLNQQYMVLGGEDPDCFWQDLFQSSLPHCQLILNCSDKEAAIIKYATNGFLALKTSYFNQIYDICYETGLDFDIVRQILTTDKRINSDHSMVPGPDCTRGWSGKSFLADIHNFINWTNKIGVPLTILDTINEYNNQIRKNY